MISPLALYADGLRALTGSGTVVAAHQVCLRDGTVLPLPLDRYLGQADETDEQLLDGLVGPVLDVGCGPGRHLHALAARGVFGLGVDLSPVAVELARGRGVHAIVGSIFGELAGAGSWRSALLLDGNIGIGGLPVRLLERIGALLCDDGVVVIELDPPDAESVSTRARIQTRGRSSGWFAWARVSVSDIDELAGVSGFHAIERWTQDGRWFARLAGHTITH
ncbi:MAG: methyltransferase domain-containing protein [Solirubrobacteraceae bacterium]